MSHWYDAELPFILHILPQRIALTWTKWWIAFVNCRCLELVELLAMFAPGDVPDALPEVMPFVQARHEAVD